MALVAISKDVIRANVILFFHDEFGDPISWFNGGTNVRKGYRYQDEQWMEVGPTLSGLPWMMRLHVKLPADDMRDLSTIDNITDAIWGKLQQVVFAAAPLDTHTIEVFAPPYPRGARSGKAKSKISATRQARKTKPTRPKKSSTKRRKKSRR
jgi:hypothetical protein